MDVPVDGPGDFEVDVLAGHAAFPDEVAASFRVRYDDGTMAAKLPRDASHVLFASVTWLPDGTSGWHSHPGPVIVSITEATLALVNERDCVVRTYTAGDAARRPLRKSCRARSVVGSPISFDAVRLQYKQPGVRDWTPPDQLPNFLSFD